MKRQNNMYPEMNMKLFHLDVKNKSLDSGVDTRLILK
jgi:hypothetical protein